MRRGENATRWRKLERLGHGPRVIRGVEMRVIAHPSEDPALPLLRRGKVVVRVESRWRFWQSGEKRSFRRAQVRWWFCEVVTARGGNAALEVSVIEAI